MKHLIFSLCLSCSLSLACGQTAIKEIIIAENKLPAQPLANSNQYKIVITQQDIVNRNIKTIPELLQWLVGVQVNRRGIWQSQTDIAINGGTFDQTLIVLNGMPLLDAQTGHHMMNLPIQVDDIEQIEILTAPQSNLYGVNAMSGCIHIITRQQSAPPATIHATAQIIPQHQKNYTNGNVHAAIQQTKQQQKLYASFSADKGEGFMAQTAFTNYRTFIQQFNYSNTHQWQWMAGYVRSDFDAAGFYAYPADTLSHEKVNTLLTQVQHTWKMNHTWQLKSALNYRLNQDVYTFIENNPSYYQNKHRTHQIQGYTQLQKQFLKAVFSTGIAYLSQHIKSTNLDTFHRQQLSYYINTSWSPVQAFNIQAGVFVNYQSTWGLHILPACNLGWQARPWLRFFVGLGTGNRLPTYTDLYYKGPANIGNPDLVPEHAIGFDAGFRVLRPHWMWQANVLQRRIHQLIDWTKNETLATWQPNNFGAQNIFGWQQILQWQQSFKHRLQIVSGMVQYQYNQISLQFPDHIISKYNLQYLKHQLMVSCTLMYNKELGISPQIQWIERLGQQQYYLADCRLFWQHQSVYVHADINNILQAQYKEANALPMPGRQYSVGIKYTMPKQ